PSFELSGIFIDQRRWREAETESRRAIARGHESFEAYRRLFQAVPPQGRTDDAGGEPRGYGARKAGVAGRNSPQGSVLLELHRLADAEAALREAVRLAPEMAEAHCNLGHALRRQGRFADALAPLRRGNDLGSPRSDWKYPSASWVRTAERLAAME